MILIIKNKKQRNISLWATNQNVTILAKNIQFEYIYILKSTKKKKLFEQQKNKDDTLRYFLALPRGFLENWAVSQRRFCLIYGGWTC